METNFCMVKPSSPSSASLSAAIRLSLSRWAEQTRVIYDDSKNGWRHGS